MPFCCILYFARVSFLHSILWISHFYYEVLLYFLCFFFFLLFSYTSRRFTSQSLSNKSFWVPYHHSVVVNFWKIMMQECYNELMFNQLKKSRRNINPSFLLDCLTWSIFTNYCQMSQTFTCSSHPRHLWPSNIVGRPLSSNLCRWVSHINILYILT